MSADVNISNFARAETDLAIKKIHHLAGGFGRWFHLRQPVPLDQQEVIRMNRDTLYSGAVLDLSRPATVHLPDTGGRYQSLQIIDTTPSPRPHQAATNSPRTRSAPGTPT